MKDMHWTFFSLGIMALYCNRPTFFYFSLPYADNFTCAHKNIESFTKQNLMFQVRDSHSKC